MRNYNVFFLPKSIKIFLWTGIDIKGHKIQGKIAAFNKQAAIIALENTTTTILSVKRTKKYSRTSAKSVLHFTQQWSELINAGLPINQSLLLIEKQADFPWVSLIKKRVDQGEWLSAIFRDFPQYFNSVYCSLIETGETTGQLGKALMQLVDYLKSLQHYKQKIKKALYYPMAVLIVAIGITVGLIEFVIPQFQETFTAFGSHLPALTRGLILLSDILRHHLLSLTFVSIIIPAGFRYLKSRMSFLQVYHKVLLKCPYLGRLLITLSLFLWSKIVNTGLKAGIPLVEALHLASRAISNLILRQKLEALTVLLKRGHSLQHAMQKTQLFSPYAIQLVAIGEQTGRLENLLDKLSEIYQEKLEAFLDLISELLEPIIMLLLAVLASFLIIALYLPVFRIGSVL